MNPNTPVMVGVAQLLNRTPDPDREPIDMMFNAIVSAAEDAGIKSKLAQVDSVRVVRGIWRYKQPAGYLAEKIGAPAAEKIGCPFGGNSVQKIVNKTALQILAGERSLVVITGAENGNTLAKARKKGVELSYRETSGKYDGMIGHEVPMACEAEMARGISAPIQMYPIFENAIRYQNGETVVAHSKRVSELWAGFSRVAANNPNAWIRDIVDAETIRTASAKNRMVSFPYPKLMNSNSAVDMSSALIMCSVEKARALGIDESKWVYPWAGTDANDHDFVSSRDNLYSSPAIRLAGNGLLEMLNLSVAELDLVDVYSCFPSAVQVAARELNLALDKPLTVTGGLTFGGGPLNNYVMHSIATMVTLARENPGKKGLITANGGFLSKHAFGVYSSEPPAQDFQYRDFQAEVDATPKKDWLVDHNGEVMIESYTVMYGAEGPAIGHAACLTADGKRTWANTEDIDLATEMTQQEFCGRRASIDGAGTLSVH